MAPNNPLPVHGNEKTMNLNHLILTNIQSSPYFKVNLFELKTYHQVIDEIYYKVEHLEPWEKGSRKTAGQTGMCGGVRGVGAGGIVSSAYCLLYKLFTLKLTKKQVIGLITHKDSTYIRGLGFMYIRYTQNPAELWDWYGDYLEDEEELDVKAGGGHVMCIGEMVKQFMVKLEWYSTLFPRIPVPIQKQIESQLKGHEQEKRNNMGYEAAPTHPAPNSDPRGRADIPEGAAAGFGEAERMAKLRESPKRGGSMDKRHDRRPSPPFDIAKEMERDKARHNREVRRSKSRERDRQRRSRSRDRGHRRSRSRDRGHKKRSRSRDRNRHRSRDRKERRRSRSHDKNRQRRSRSRDRHGGNHSHRETSFERDLRREKERIRNGR